MRRFTAFLLVALMFAAPAKVFAKGGYVRLPEPKLIGTGPPIPDLQLSPSPVLGGCGTKRYRDPETHKCRGPADFGE
jgi:hypothetical protein